MRGRAHCHRQRAQRRGVSCRARSARPEGARSACPDSMPIHADMAISPPTATRWVCRASRLEGQLGCHARLGTPLAHCLHGLSKYTSQKCKWEPPISGNSKARAEQRGHGLGAAGSRLFMQLPLAHQECRRNLLAFVFAGVVNRLDRGGDDMPSTWPSPLESPSFVRVRAISQLRSGSGPSAFLGPLETMDPQVRPRRAP